MHVRSRLLGVAALVALLSAAGVNTALEHGSAAAAQTAAPSSIVSGQVQFDSNGPVRIYDTRDGTGLGGRIFPVNITCCGIVMPDSVPSNASAALVNITVIAFDPASYGFLAAYGAGYRGTSTLNWNGLGTVSNFALAPLQTYTYGPTSTKYFHLDYWGNNDPRVHIIVDLVGWVAPTPG